MTQLKIDYASFDDYMAKALSHATRKDLRRKFKAAAKSDPIELQVVQDIEPYIGEVYPLYVQVYERSRLHFEKLTPAYMKSLGKRMGDKARFFIWRQKGRAVAFSLCLVHGDAIYDEYLGLDYSIALDLHLYFYTFRDIVQWAIEHGLKRYCSSALNYDPKLHLGCDLAPLDLYVMHTAPLLNPVFRRAVKFLEPTRHDPVLRRFRNAAELQ